MVSHSWPPAHDTVWIPGDTLTGVPDGFNEQRNYYFAVVKTDGRRLVERVVLVGSTDPLRKLALESFAPDDEVRLQWSNFVRPYMHYLSRELYGRPKLFLDWDGLLVATPVTQVPYLYDKQWGGFIPHAATFAHHVLANHDMHAYDLCQKANWNWTPGTALSSEAVQRNQEALRYFRILIGHSLRKFNEWGALDPEGTVTGSADDWQSELPKMQELDSKLCDVCGGTEFAIRDFVMSMALPLAWKLALNTIHPNVETSASGATTTTSYYRRLPEIQRTSIGVTPHPTDSVATWNGTREADLSGASYEKICIDYFNRARKLWDTDARARFDIHSH